VNQLRVSLSHKTLIHMGWDGELCAVCDAPASVSSLKCLSQNTDPAAHIFQAETCKDAEIADIEHDKTIANRSKNPKCRLGSMGTKRRSE